MPYHSPMSTAPAISNIVASIQACVSVSTLEPTLVPNEFATSFAPIPKAKTNATTNPLTTSHIKSSANGSIVSIPNIQTHKRIFIQNNIFSTYST